MKIAQYIPRATEKAYVAQTRREYIFFVPQGASKQEIAKKIGEEFKVTVIDVRTTIRKGKKTKYSKGKHAYPGVTYRRDRKVAYVTLKDGDKIPVFAEEKEEVKEDKKANKKADKKSETSETKTEEKKTTKKAAKKVATKEEDK